MKLEVDGVKLSIPQAAARFGLSEYCLRDRLKRGVSPEFLFVPGTGAHEPEVPTKRPENVVAPKLPKWMSPELAAVCGLIDAEEYLACYERGPP